MSHVRFNPLFLFDLLLNSRSLPITSAYYDQAFCFVKKIMLLEMHACTWARGKGALWSQLLVGRKNLT
jgi:hypothetical protein